jgi:predicted nuclease of predicted toxin-antitoxin system
VHVRGVGLLGAPDGHVWAYARDHGFTILSKDNDFRPRSFLDGAPPKVVWLHVGNASTQLIHDLLRRSVSQLTSFDVDAEAALLVLS